MAKWCLPRLLSSLLLMGIGGGLGVKVMPVRAESLPVSTTSVKQVTKSSNATKMGRFFARYEPTTDYKELRDFLIETQQFDQLMEALNASGLIIRQNISVVFLECQVPNAYWDKNTQEIKMCYELMADEFRRFQERYGDQVALEKMLNLNEFVFFHELGHGLIDVLQLNAVGQEEDTVDQFAAILLLESFAEQGAEIILAAVDSYELELLQNLDVPAWDEHAPNDKRLFNLVCLVFGYNPSQYESMFVEKVNTLFKIDPEKNVADAEVIADRAARCEIDYPLQAKRWQNLLLPHMATLNQNRGRATRGTSRGSSRRSTYW